MQQSELKEKQRLDAQRRRDQQRQMLQDMREKRLQEIEQAKEARRVEVAKRSPTASLLPIEEHVFHMSFTGDDWRMLLQVESFRELERRVKELQVYVGICTFVPVKRVN